MKTKLYFRVIGILVFTAVLFGNANAQWWRSRGISSHAVPNPATVGDTVSVIIHARATDTLTINVYNVADSSLVQTLPASDGANELAPLAKGVYLYQVVNTSGRIVSAGTILVRGPRVEAHVVPGVSTVGDTVSIVVQAPATSSFTLDVSDTSGVVQTLTVTGGTTALPSLPVGLYSYTLTDADGNVVARGGFAVRAPIVRSHVEPFHAHTGDTVSIVVSAPATSSFTMNIYTNGDSLVSTLTVTGGTTVLPALASGFYGYELIDADGYTVSRGKFVILPPHVHTLIAPNPSNPGEGSITVDADASETFTLNVYSAATLIYSDTVTGGTTALPSTLTSGVYFYTVVNGNGDVVSRGRIMIY